MRPPCQLVKTELLSHRTLATRFAFDTRINGSVSNMRRYGTGERAVRGVLRRRLLVNAVVDPDEAAGRLPAGLRPHETPLGTVVGCCLLDITDLRPRLLPAAAGIRQRAA